MKRALIISASIASLLMIVGVSVFIGYVLAGTSLVKPAPAYAPFVAEQDPALLQSLRDIAKDDTTLNEMSIVTGDTSEFGEKSQAASQEVEYEDNQTRATITVSPSISESNMKQILAHEYLHTVWNRLTADDMKLLERDVLAQYASNATLNNRMKYYATEKTLTPTEVFSILRTEFKDDEMTATTLAACNKYIDRSVLTLKVINE